LKVDFSKKETQIRDIITKKQPDRKNHQKKRKRAKKKHINTLIFPSGLCFLVFFVVVSKAIGKPSPKSYQIIIFTGGIETINPYE